MPPPRRNRRAAAGSMRALDEVDEPASGTIWPPANFELWPATRTASLVFDGLLLAAVLLVLCVPLLRHRAARCPTTSNMCCLITTAILIGVFGGMWLHFVPCIWWTCDWGPYDGQGVRGGIWLIGGILLAILACSLLGLQRVKEKREQGAASEMRAGGV